MSALFHRKKRRPRRLVTIAELSRPPIPARPELSPRLRRAIWSTIGIVLLVLFVVGDRGAWRHFTLLHLRHQLAAQERALNAEIADLETRHRLLSSDTTYIEKVARTEYRLSRPDEIIYEITPKQPPAPPKGNATP